MLDRRDLIERANDLIEARQMAANDAAHGVVYDAMAMHLVYIAAALEASSRQEERLREAIGEMGLRPENCGKAGGRVCADILDLMDSPPHAEEQG